MPSRLPFDRVASIYDATRGLPPRVLARVLGVLFEELHGERVLEVGVGTGRYAVPLQKSGVRLLGVDISRRMVELGLAKGLRDVLFADGARLPFRDDAFDAATTNHMLHLVPDWREVLLEIARVTRERFVSVLEDGDRWPPKKEYDQLVRDAGHVWKAPGLHERALFEGLKPDVIMPVGPFHETVDADAVLVELERRDYSSQWDVPEGIHRRVMERLREVWAGRELTRTYSIDVAFWRMHRIEAFVRRPTS
jgi:SAM-dependent methyltransferase